MTKHWIRDVPLTMKTYNPGLGQINYLVFHFLRNAGWDWLWECDGYAGDSPNRVTDGNMEAVGTAEWTPVNGGSVSKVTTPVHSGLQALEVKSWASGDGVVMTNVLTSMEAIQYLVAIWARNTTGQPWTVWDGATLLGSIPSGSDYELTKFTATLGVLSKLKILDSNGSVGTIHISDILVVKSYFEHTPLDNWQSGTDGVVSAPDQFSSGSYSFVAGDIGKYICVWDGTTSNKNSGAYKILSVLAGVATVDMRSGSATFTPAINLKWRMIDLTKAPDNASNTDTGQRGAGFGLQSPHSSKWRWFVRQSVRSTTGYCQVGTWGAPTDTDFNFSTGTFYKTGPSTQNEKQAAYTLGPTGGPDWTNMHFWNYCYGLNVVGNRFYLMVDHDGQSVAMVMRDAGGSNIHDTQVIGYLGSSVYFPGEESWGFFARWNNYNFSTPPGSGIYWDNNWVRFTRKGTMVGPDGKAKDACWAQYGFGSGTSDVNLMSNAGDNPWSAREWLHKPNIMRDPDDTGFAPGEMTADIGVYQGRDNLPAFATFDSNAYMHFHHGLVWEWMGESVIP